jgi:ribosome-binding factor A
MGDNSPKETLAALDHARGYMRRELGLRTKLRYVPELKFQYDEGMAEGMRINALIDEVAAADAPASAGSEAADQ